MDTEVLRVARIDEFVGQEKVLRRLRTHIAAALSESRPLEHTLLAGEPGSGKSTLARIVASELGDPLEILTMPVTDKTLQGMVLKHAGILLLDEVHAASKTIQESLMPLLEFGYLQTKTGYRIEAGWLTIIGATTEPENVIPPLYDRFKIKPAFEPYSEEEMGLIVLGMAAKADFEVSDNDTIVLGRATGGVPRNAADFILAGRALRAESGDLPSAREILEFCDTDEIGLGRLHYRYLEMLGKFGGNRGLKPVATALRLSESHCLNIERLLFRHGLINYGNTGRELTSSGYAKIRKPKETG